MSISIDIEKDWYYAGETVTGTVRVLKDAPKANHLDVSVWYQGKHVAAKGHDQQRLATGGVNAGDTFPFELTIPLGVPHTFEGHRISVNWYAYATLDVPWAIDPREKAPFTLRPLAIEGPTEFANWQERLGEGEKKADAAELSGCVKVVLFVVFAPLVLMLLPIVAPFALLFWAKSALIKTRMRDLKLQAPTRPIALGEWIPVDLSFELRKPVRVEKLTVTLKGQEHWVTRSNKNTHHHYHTFYEQENDLTGDMVLAPTSKNAPGTFRVRSWVEAPRQGLPSVPVGKAVFYTLTGRVWLVGWPDPSATAEPQMAAARVVDLPQPPPMDLETESQDIVFVPEGSPGPSGVDITVARDSVWFFLLLPFLGLGLVGADIGLWAAEGRDLAMLLNLPVGQAFVFTAVGVLLTLTGIAGIAWKVTR